MAVCETSPTKQKRRSRSAINRIRDSIVEVLDLYQPMTVRQVFYQLVTRGVIDKTEGEYKTTICRLLARMRRDGTVPFGWIADNTRWMRKPTTYRSLETMLHRSQALYRRDVWDSQGVYVEIWLEKEALAGVLIDVTAKWDVPLMVTRGYPSLSFLHSAAQSIAWHEKPAFLYYFGDRDPSSVDIDRAVESGIREMAPDVDLTFTRAAVTEDQIGEYDLPTRPTKKSDSRSKNFRGDSVEVDAIDPPLLKEICEKCITDHLDFELHERLLKTEELERETLRTFAENFGSGAA